MDSRTILTVIIIGVPAGLLVAFMVWLLRLLIEDRREARRQGRIS